MKQNITQSDLNQLSEKGKSELFAWAYSKQYVYLGNKGLEVDNKGFTIKSSPPLLSIGQMIEFLDEHKVHYLQALECEWPNYDCDYDKFFKAEDVCDALWEAVKEVLNSSPHKS